MGVKQIFAAILCLFYLGCDVSRKEVTQSPMVIELSKIPDSIDIEKAFFLSDLWLEYQPDLSKYGFEDLNLETQYASKLVEAGRTKEGINKYIEIKEKYDYSLTDSKLNDINFFLAVAYLRDGEQTNCLEYHNMESCLVPIKGSGIYRDKSSVLKAIELLEGVCEFSLKMKGVVNPQAKWLINIANMAIGKYPENVPLETLIDTTFFQSEAHIGVFQDVAMAAGVATKSLAGGAIMDDFNNDGWLDIMTTNMSLKGQMKFYVNNKDGTFSDHTSEAGLIGQVGGLNMVQTDYNNDGYLDVFIPRGGWFEENGLLFPNSLLKNNGDGTFTDVTIESGLYSKFPTMVAIWADINLDGWVDLFIGNEGSFDEEKPNYLDELYLNNGDGTFKNITDEAGLDKRLFVKGATWIDYNNDSYPDLAITALGNKTESIVLYKNNTLETGNVSFEEVTKEANIDNYPKGLFALWSWDYNNDGNEDLFANAMGGLFANRPNSDKFQAVCLKNNGDGTFSDVTSDMGLEHTEKTMGCNFGDVNNDGFDDIYLGTGSPLFEDIIPNRMFLNKAGEKFTDITMSANMGHVQKGHGVGFGDYDNDGDQDIFIELGGAYDGDIYQDALFQNPGNDNHSVSFLLEGTKSNKSALETKLILTIEEDGVERKIYSKVTSGSSFGGNSLRQDIGVGKALEVKKLEVYWSGSGLNQTFYNIPVRGFYKIIEGESVVLKTSLDSTS